MTRLKFGNLIRAYTKQSSTSLADADILLLANSTKDDLSELIASRDLKGNYFIVPATDILIANQREYAEPDELLDHIFSVEFAFSSTTDSFGQLPYIKAYPDDFEKWGVSRTEANIQSHYGNGRGRVAYTIQRRSIYLLSGAIDATTLGASTITNGIRIRYRAYPDNLTDVTDDTIDMSVDPSTTTFGFPRQFHELWARLCAITWKAQHPGAVPPTQLEAMYPQDLELKLQAMNNPDLGGETIGVIPQQDEHNSVGFDL